MGDYTVAIIGGTGKTGQWAVKGALQRGYKVRMLARNPDKVKGLLVELFGEAEGDSHLNTVTVVKGGVMDKEALKELFTGAGVVLSFLGMPASSDGKTWVVCPGVQTIMEVLNNMDGSRPKFVSMSAMGLGGSREQGKKSHWFMGRVLVHLCIPYLLKDCFADMDAAEQYIIADRAKGNDRVVTTIIRAPILGSKKTFTNFTDKSAVQYRYVDATVTSGIGSSFLDRQDVAYGFLDCVETGEHDNRDITVVKK